MQIFTEEAIKAMERAEIPCDVVIEVLSRRRQKPRGIRKLLYYLSFLTPPKIYLQEEIPIRVCITTPSREVLGIDIEGKIIKRFDDWYALPGDKMTLHELFCRFEVTGLGE